VDYEGHAFSHTRDVQEDLLGITSVHPMRLEAVKEFLQAAGADWQVMTQLLREDKIKRIEFERNTYYMRKFSGKKKRRISVKRAAQQSGLNRTGGI
jgi:hypothetical protein